MKKFEYIYKDIKKKIDDEFYKTGTFLPKENDLAKEYNVSRETLRKAENLLQDEGFIQKIHGRGAKVLDLKRLEITANKITIFSQISNRFKGNLKTKILKNKLEYLNKGQFGYDEANGKAVLSIESLRILNDEAIIFDKDYFIVDIIGKAIPDKHLYSSTYDYFEKELMLKVGFAHKDITIETPNDEVKLTLDIGNHTHVVATRSLAYLENAQLFQIHEAFQRVDTFHLSDIARR